MMMMAMPDASWDLCGLIQQQHKQENKKSRDNTNCKGSNSNKVGLEPTMKRTVMLVNMTRTLVMMMMIVSCCLSLGTVDAFHPSSWSLSLVKHSYWHNKHHHNKQNDNVVLQKGPMLWRPPVHGVTSRARNGSALSSVSVGYTILAMAASEKSKSNEKKRKSMASNNHKASLNKRNSNPTFASDANMTNNRKQNKMGSSKRKQSHKHQKGVGTTGTVDSIAKQDLSDPTKGDAAMASGTSLEEQLHVKVSDMKNRSSEGETITRTFLPCRDSCFSIHWNPVLSFWSYP